MRSSDHSHLSGFKDVYLRYRAKFDKQTPLRFAVGDEVEFLYELETGNEWQLGRVVELYYREKSFDISLSAPYRLQLLEGSDSTYQPPVYAWVKADLDRYVRKPGVRSIEDTRYQARLDAKVVELAEVYCSEVFIHELCCTLSQDREFVEMLQSVWQIVLSYEMLSLYRLYVMYRQPLVRTDTGYHVPTAEEVIAGIRAYFDPAHLSSDAAPTALSEDSLQRIRVTLIALFRWAPIDMTDTIDTSDVQRLLVEGIRNFLAVWSRADPSGSTAGLCDDSYVASLLAVSQPLLKVSTTRDIIDMLSGVVGIPHRFLSAWVNVHICLENPDAGPACECPFVYFFVKCCLDRGLGVPKLALALYDRMNMQLSRELIRCANPTCELNKLDKSTGKIKFKNCSRCKAVIYCSRDCQVAHYPEHKRLCREPSTGCEGS